MKYTGQDLVDAREAAGHSQVKAAVIIGISVNLVVGFEKRNEEPKGDLYKRAIEAYISKHRGGQ